MATRGGDKGYVQRRAPRHDGWTVERRAGFLDVLVATCNVEAAARSVGLTSHGARALRARDGEFAALWADAFAAGVERLREELVTTALGYTSTGNNPSGERAEVEPGPIDPALAIKILQLRAGGSPGRRSARPTRPSQHEVDRALIERLDALAARKAARAERASAK